MTAEQKAQILAQISTLLDEVTDDPSPSKSETVKEVPEMLTIKECAELVKGLSVHTIRLLVLNGKIASFRTGMGKNGKILVPKASLLAYIEQLQEKR